MCRLLAARAWTREGAGILARLARLTVKAAEDDPYLQRIIGGEKGQARHCHGYGYVLYRGGEQAATIHYEKGDSGSCTMNLRLAREAAEKVATLLGGLEPGEAMLVLHLRRASRGEPRGVHAAHPYHFSTVARDVKGRGPTDIFLAHNGSVDKMRIIESLGPGMGNPMTYTDSQMLGYWISETVREGTDPQTALYTGFEYARSGYNVAMLVLKQSGLAELYVATGYTDRVAGRKDREDYYRPYLFAGPGVTGFMSSTIRDLAVKDGMSLTILEAVHGVYVIPRGGPELLMEFGK